MNKRPGLRKRLALEVTAMFRPSILTCRSKIS